MSFYLLREGAEFGGTDFGKRVGGSPVNSGRWHRNFPGTGSRFAGEAGVLDAVPLNEIQGLPGILVAGRMLLLADEFPEPGVLITMAWPSRRIIPLRESRFICVVTVSPTVPPPFARTASRAASTDGTANAMWRNPGRFAWEGGSSGIDANW